jgi:hypothetical protein
MKRVIAAVLSLSLSASGCAMSRRATTTYPLDRTTQQEVITSYAEQLRIGTRVRATLDDNRVVRGTLVKKTPDALIVQPRGRVAEPLVELRLTDLRSVEQEQPKTGSTGKAIAVGAAVGAGVSLGVLMLLAAVVWSD